MRWRWIIGGLLLILAAGCSGGDQARAIDAIKKLQGAYAIDEERPGKPVIKVNLGMSAATDQTMERIKKLPQLQELAIWNTGVTDAGMAHLAGLAELHSIDLSDTAVSDEGIKHLKGLTKLQRVVVKNTQVTPAGVRELKQALPQADIVR